MPHPGYDRPPRGPQRRSPNPDRPACRQRPPAVSSTPVAKQVDPSLARGRDPALDPAASTHTPIGRHILCRHLAATRRHPASRILGLRQPPRLCDVPHNIPLRRIALDIRTFSEHSSYITDTEIADDRVCSGCRLACVHERLHHRRGLLHRGDVTSPSATAPNTSRKAAFSATS